MNKEEILAQSRKDNNGKTDEREAHLLAKSSQIGMCVGGILAALIVLYSEIVEIPVLGLAAWSVYFLMFGSSHLYRFIKTKEKVQLVQTLIGLIVGTACLVGMIIVGLM